MNRSCAYSTHSDQRDRRDNIALYNYRAQYTVVSVSRGITSICLDGWSEIPTSFKCLAGGEYDRMFFTD